MEQKLKLLIEKVKESALAEDEKRQIFETIFRALVTSVWPAVYPYIPKEKLNKYVRSTDPVSLDEYVSLISEGVKDGRAMKDLARKLDALVVEMNRLLTKEGIT